MDKCYRCGKEIPSDAMKYKEIKYGKEERVCEDCFMKRKKIIEELK